MRSVAGGRGVAAMADCKWMLDEFCVNDQCPMYTDYCPVVDYPGVCRFEERGEANGDVQIL